MSTEKKLSNNFVFWYHIINNSTEQDYKSQIKKLAQFDTLEGFWSIFQYLKKPDDFKQPIEFQLFKEGIAPMWEDENNKNGGRVALKLRKEFSNLVWEELVFAFIGGYLANDVKDEINGLVINCKKDFNTLQIWTKSFTEEVTTYIEKNIREILCIPKEVVLDIKPFNMLNKEYNSHNTYNNNYNNYNNNYNYKGNYNKKSRSNNYYKKRDNYDVNKDYKYNDNKEKDLKEVKEENKIENEKQEETDKGKNQEEMNVEKKEIKEIKENKENKEDDKPIQKEKEDFKEVKKKKKKKKD